MSDNIPSVQSRITNKLSWYYRYLVRSKNQTIYHCCIQKTGSQWFKQVFRDEIIWNNLKIHIYSPDDNFITEDKKVLKRLSNIPKNIIVSPLYIRYNKFDSLDKPLGNKTFFIARDPRDLIISNYFSLKHSHNPYHPYILEMRNKLNNMSQEEGISEIINSFTKGTKETLEGWFLQKSKNIMLIKFEDIFGDEQVKIFSELLKHCELQISRKDIDNLLEKYSFKNISGRKLGKEDVKHHYRKGTPGDWKNYFNDEHRKLFKTLSGGLLITCGYEKDNNW